MTKIVKNDLFDYKNRYIYQDRENFKFSLDSVLLSEFIEINKSDNNILDFCTGNAPIPLILSTKYDKNFIGFEIQKKIYDLAIMSISENKLEGKIKIINDDIKNIGNYYSKEYFDVISCNPPYFKYQEDAHINCNIEKSIARHEIYLKLEDVFLFASQYLKVNGKFFLVHRADRLDEIIIYANKYDLNVKKIQLICTNGTNIPYIVLIKCVKKAKNGVIICPVINIMNLKTYQNLFEEEKK